MRILFVNIVALLALSFSFNTYAGLLYPYHRLAVKNLDQMNKIVQDKIKESKKVRGDKTIPLKEALQAVLSRPNDDFMIEKVIAPLRNELEESNAWESSVKALVKESTGALKNEKAFRPEALATYAIFLENLILEFKPKATEEFEKSILMQIVMSNKVKKERSLKMMKVQNSPSEIADVILKELEKSEKPEKISK
jgi:hypothetical protein